MSHFWGPKWGLDVGFDHFLTNFSLFLSKNRVRFWKNQCGSGSCEKGGESGPFLDQNWSPGRTIYNLTTFHKSFCRMGFWGQKVSHFLGPLLAGPAQKSKSALLGVFAHTAFWVSFGSKTESLLGPKLTPF